MYCSCWILITQVAGITQSFSLECRRLIYNLSVGCWVSDDIHHSFLMKMNSFLFLVSVAMVGLSLVELFMLVYIPIRVPIVSEYVCSLVFSAVMSVYWGLSGFSNLLLFLISLWLSVFLWLLSLQLCRIRDWLWFLSVLIVRVVAS